MKFIYLRLLRTRLLILLDVAYPKSLDEVMLRSADDKRHGLKMIRREIAYLADKGLVRLKRKKGNPRPVIITARGRDFLSGDVTEVGLEPCDTFGYDGPPNLT